MARTSPLQRTVIAARRGDEDALLVRLRADGERIGAAFGLRFQSLRRARSDAKLYGACDVDGHIRLRLRSRTDGNLLAYSSLIATLCHEIAHLKHMNHGPRFVALNREILEWARRAGIYQPRSTRRVEPLAAGPVHAGVAASAPPAPTRTPARRPQPTPPGPRQLELFK